MKRKEVVVVGAGMSGLVAAKVLIEHGHSVRILEQSDALGGTWRYDKGSSSMYQSLTTNLPKHVMSFSDFEYPQTFPQYPTHSQILSYLESYANTFNLSRLITFNAKVDLIEKTSKWAVTFTLYDTSQSIQSDAVCICSGKYSVPFTPSIPGLTSTEISISHSHSYRTPLNFKGKSVLVIGSGFSAFDIASDMKRKAHQVFISAKNENAQFFIDHPTFETSPRNFKWIKKFLLPMVSEFGTKFVRFSDGTEREFDCVLFCTGYRFVFPLLRNVLMHGGLEGVGGEGMHHKYVNRMYKQMFLSDFWDGSVSILGLPYRVSPFPLCEVQAEYLAHVLAEEIKLPSVNEMQRICDEERKKCTNLALFHKTDHNKYCSDILSQFQHLPNAKQFKLSEDRSLSVI